MHALIVASSWPGVQTRVCLRSALFQVVAARARARMYLCDAVAYFRRHFAGDAASQ